MDKNLTIILGTLILALAVVASVFMFTHSNPQPATPSPTMSSYWGQLKTACIEGGGYWTGAVCTDIPRA